MSDRLSGWFSKTEIFNEMVECHHDDDIMKLYGRACIGQICYIGRYAIESNQCNLSGKQSGT